jgi:hypothetical protein
MRIILLGIGLPRGVLSGRQPEHRVRIAAGCDMERPVRRFYRGHAIPIYVDHETFYRVGQVRAIFDTAAGLVIKAAIKPEWWRDFARAKDAEEIEIPVSASISGGAEVTHEFLGDRVERVETFETIDKVREFSLCSRGEPTFSTCFLRFAGVED